MRWAAILLALAACTDGAGSGGEQTLSMPACVLLCGQRAMNVNVVADTPRAPGNSSGGSVQLSVSRP